MKLVVATSQFPVSSDIGANLRYILSHMKRAKDRGAKVMHFCEASLSGYAGCDFATFRVFDWDTLAQASSTIVEHARKLRLWVLFGSAHRLTGRRKPHNCVYVVNDRGDLVDRYDKMFCAGDRSGKVGDLSHFTSGSHFCVVDIGRVRCGLLICHDYRYPELYREYKRRGVDLMFHSYHAGNIKHATLAKMRAQIGKRNFGLNPGTTYPEITMPATMHAAAASSHVWISCSNSSARESCWPAFMMRADGVVVGRLRRNVAGLLISTADTSAPLYDSTKHWRSRAMSGEYHSGRLVEDPRSDDRQRF